MEARATFFFRRRYVVGALILAMDAGAGCAGRRPQSATSTLGTDLLRAPRGITIPPPSIGIDLVRRQTDKSHDPNIAPAVNR